MVKNFRNELLLSYNFKELLEDDKILKVGVRTQEMATYLYHDFDIMVRNTLDVRYMHAIALVARCEPNVFNEMSEDYSKQRHRIIVDEWDEKELSEDAIELAAKDVQINIELFKFYGRNLQSKTPFEKQSDYIERLINTYCHPYINFYYDDDGWTKKIIFKRLEKVYLKATAKNVSRKVYEIMKGNRCVICGETALYHKYYPCKYKLTQFI